MDATEPLVELRAVFFGYDSARDVLKNVDLRLRSGEKVGLGGPNGSGKTTLLHLVVGLLTPREGSVLAFGRERRAEKDFLEVRRRVGLLFQDPDDQLFCPTVAEDVAFGPLNLGVSSEESREVVAQTLEMLGLEGYQERITYKLSMGEKRLVSLAAVLAMKPEVLLLDEPTSALDEETAERMSTILSGLDSAMLVVSHDRGLLDGVTGRRLDLRDGLLSQGAS